MTVGQLRFTLVYSGNDLWDYGFVITTPNVNAPKIGAYYNRDGEDLPDGVVKNDTLVTGGYVDEDFKYGSCRSYGVWVKSIVFPSVTQTPKGLYTISIHDVEYCPSYGFPSNGPGLVKPFELSVYNENNVLVELLTHNDSNMNGTNDTSTPRTFSFTVV